MFIRKENLKISHQTMDAETAMRQIGQILVDANSVQPTYIENMLSSYKEFGPYFVIAPGVAIAHAKPDDSVITNDIALMICHSPVNFQSHNDPVTLLFGLCATGAHQHMEVLTKVATLLSDSDAINAITEAENETALYELLNTLADKT